MPTRVLSWWPGLVSAFTMWRSWLKTPTTRLVAPGRGPSSPLRVRGRSRKKSRMIFPRHAPEHAASSMREAREALANALVPLLSNRHTSGPPKIDQAAIDQAVEDVLAEIDSACSTWPTSVPATVAAETALMCMSIVNAGRAVGRLKAQTPETISVVLLWQHLMWAESTVLQRLGSWLENGSQPVSDT